MVDVVVVVVVVVLVVVLVVTVTHTRSDVYVGATLWIWSTPQTVKNWQTRLEVVVGAII
jgi:hypothetical protein